MPAILSDQHEAIAFLERTGPRVANERIDTHVSMVFLVGDRAYKLKRAVQFSYLDFSTLKRREAACRAEVALNSRTAPDLYLGVRSITREDDGAYAFDGAGTVLDYVVEMHRFDQEALFDRMAERGALNDPIMEDLSVVVAALHASAEQTPGFGGRASLEAEIAGNDENLALAPPEMFPPELCTALVGRWRAALVRTATALDRRDGGGKVRRCHGDLHLHNICLWHGRPTLFDCIEFSEHLACIDVLYDLAFLLMDLRNRGLESFANRVFNTYLDRSDESDGIAALPLMMSLRAAIRAHTGLATAHAQSDPAEARGIIEQSRTYLFLAEHLLDERTPRLIAVGGLSGTGKSTIARALGPQVASCPGARLLHTDVIRKGLFGVAKTERLGAQAYESAVNERVYELQRDEAAAYLRDGVSVIVDGVYARPGERAAIADTARNCGVPFTGLWLKAPVDVLRARIGSRRNDVSDATVAILEGQLAQDPGEIDWLAIDAAADAQSVARAACAALARNTT